MSGNSWATEEAPPFGRGGITRHGASSDGARGILLFGVDESPNLFYRSITERKGVEKHAKGVASEALRDSELGSPTRVRAGSNSVRQQFPGMKGSRLDQADKQFITGGTTLIFPREPFLHRS